MEREQIIIIGDRILRKHELYKGQGECGKKFAKLSFPQKIKILVDLQKLAYTWGNKKDLFVWKI